MHKVLNKRRCFEELSEITRPADAEATVTPGTSTSSSSKQRRLDDRSVSSSLSTRRSEKKPKREHKPPGSRCDLGGTSGPSSSRSHREEPEDAAEQTQLYSEEEMDELEKRCNAIRAPSGGADTRARRRDRYPSRSPSPRAPATSSQPKVARVIKKTKERPSSREPDRRPPMLPTYKRDEHPQPGTSSSGFPGKPEKYNLPAQYIEVEKDKIRKQAEAALREAETEAERLVVKLHRDM